MTVHVDEMLGDRMCRFTLMRCLVEDDRMCAFTLMGW